MCRPSSAGERSSTASRQLSEVKHVPAQLVLRWVTTLEPRVLNIFVLWSRTGSVVGATPTLHTQLRAPRTACAHRLAQEPVRRAHLGLRQSRLVSKNNYS